MKILSKVATLTSQLYDRKKSQADVKSVSEHATEVSQTEIVKVDNSKAIVVASENQDYLTAPAPGGEIVQWSPAMQSLLEEPPSKLPFQLIAGGITFFLLFTAWAWFGEVEKIGKAQGKLVPKGETFKIESLESAKISEIAVEEGEEVDAGQLIAKLESGEQAREVDRLEEALASAEVELQQKLNLLDKVEVEGQTYKLIDRAEVRSQNLAIESARSQVEVTSKLLEQQQAELSAALAREQKTQQLSGLDREKIAQIESEIADHQARVARLKPLAAEGAISQEFVFQAQQDLRQSQQALINTKSQGIGSTSEQIFQSEESLRTKKAQITQTQGELMAARKEYERLQSDLDRTKAERYNIENGAQQKIQQLELEATQIKDKIAQTKSELAKAESRLEQKSLESPVDGTVLAFNVVNTGKVVQAGETVAEIAPNEAPLVLSAFLPDRDAGFVERGMTAQVKLDAYSYQDYGVIPGKVVEIAANTTVDEQLGSGYQVKIELDRANIVDEGREISFKPGQTATAEIVIRKVRVINLLLDPIKKMQQDGINL